MTISDNTEMRYEFGRNWARFIDKHLTDQRVLIAQRELLKFLKKESLAGLRMIDIGCGSGIHSLAALRSGVRELISFDYDHPENALLTRRQRAGKRGIQVKNASFKMAFLNR
jgi:predicted RNA methylase